jgi:hypothetical protein
MQFTQREAHCTYRLSLTDLVNMLRYAAVSGGGEAANSLFSNDTHYVSQYHYNRG